MSPEFGPTATLFPIDDETLAYLRLTGRAADRIALASVTPKSRAMAPARRHARIRRAVTLDLGSVEPLWRGRVARRTASRCGSAQQLPRAYPQGLEEKARAAVAAGPRTRAIPRAQPPPQARKLSERASRGGRRTVGISNGSVAIAAITSCTNTSNPTVMVAAGLLARNAVARGLVVPPTVKRAWRRAPRP